MSHSLWFAVFMKKCMHKHTQNKKDMQFHTFMEPLLCAETLDMHDVYEFLFKDENLFSNNEHGKYFFVIFLSFDDVCIKVFGRYFNLDNELCNSFCTNYNWLTCCKKYEYRFRILLSNKEQIAILEIGILHFWIRFY